MSQWVSDRLLPQQDKECGGGGCTVHLPIEGGSMGQEVRWVKEMEAYKVGKMQGRKAVIRERF